MRRGICALLCLAAFSPSAFAQAIDQAKLRQFIELPALHTSVGVSFRSSERDPKGNKLDPDAKIAELQKKLTGGPEDGEVLLEQRAVYLECFRKSATTVEAIERKAKEVVVKAEAVLRPYAATTDPKQGHLVAAYATTLEVLKDDPWKDCEAWARRAVSVSPQDWRPWAYLGHVRHQQIPTILCGGDDKQLVPGRRAQQVIGMLYLQRFRSRDVDQAEKVLNEALQCYDKAKALAPNDPERQVRRYGFRVTEIVLRNAICIYRGQKPAYPKAQLERVLLDELQDAARLHPDHLFWQSQLAHQLILRGWQENPDKEEKPAKVFRAARPEDTHAIRAALDRIEKLASDGRGETVVYCNLILAALNSAMLDHAAVEKHARRALQIDPKNQTAAEQLQQALVSLGRHADQLVASQAFLKNVNTSRNWYIVTKALVANQRYDLAEEACVAGLKVNPNDSHCLLGSVVLLLRRTNDPRALAAAQSALDKASLVCRPEAGANLLTDLDYLTAIHQVLTGDVTLGRLKLQRLQAEDPTNARYEKALSAIGR